MSNKRIIYGFFALLTVLSACNSVKKAAMRPDATGTAPANLPAVKLFTAGQKLKAIKSVKLPDSPYTLVYTAVERSEEKEVWSQDPADGIRAYIFVRIDSSGHINEALTAGLNSRLGAGRFYEPDWCGGLGSLDTATFKTKDKALIISRFYAPGTRRTNCEQELFFADGKIDLRDTGSGESGLNAEAVTDREAMHKKALAAFRAGKTDAAAEIWNKMYGFWKYGPHAAAGPSREVLFNLGKVRAKKGNDEGAKSLFLECKKHFPAYSPAILALADVQAKTGEKAKAKRNYRLFMLSSGTAKEKAYAMKQIKKLK